MAIAAFVLVPLPASGTPLAPDSTAPPSTVFFQVRIVTLWPCAAYTRPRAAGHWSWSM